MNEVDQLPPVKEGLWFYAGVTTCHVRIVHHADDPPELAADREMPCFYVRYHGPMPSQPWCDGGAALSLREAMFLAERRLGQVVNWLD